MTPNETPHPRTEDTMSKERKTCQLCGEKRKTIETPYGKFWCASCFKEDFAICKKCGNVEDARDVKKGLCLDCAAEARIN